MLKKSFVLAVKRNLNILCDRLYMNPRILKANRKIDQLSIELYKSLDEQSRKKVDEICQAYDSMIDIIPRYYYVRGIQEGLNLRNEIKKGGF